MTAIISDVVVAAAGLTAILTLIDWLLSDAQKNRLTEQSIAIWNAIDETREGIVIFLFVRPKFHYIIMILSTIGMTILYMRALLIALGIVDTEPSTNSPAEAIALSSGLILGWGFLIMMKKPMIRLLSSSNNLYTYTTTVVVIWLSLKVILAITTIVGEAITNDSDGLLAS